jgi:hypothetical protein
MTWYWCVIGAAALWVFGATASATAAEPPVAYRRVLVPADTPSAWPGDGEKFLPVESRDFEAWLAAANHPPAESSIVDAAYHARLEGQQLVDTTGRWQVALRGEGPARLPLATGPLVIQRARWSDESPQRAQLGWWPERHGSQLVYALRVPRSGELEFDWRAPTLNVVGGSLEVPLRLPTAARTCLVLDLPEGQRPEIAGGLILDSPTEASDQASDNIRRWVIGIGDTPSTVLRIVDAKGHVWPSSPAATLEESVRYVVRNRGFDMESRLRINASQSPLSQLSVTLPAGLQLIEATTGDRNLTWTTMPADKSGGLNRVALKLPAFPESGELIVVLHAWGAVPFDESWQLPRFLYDGLFWTSGSTELSIDNSLELSALTPVDCIQAAASAGTTERQSIGRSLSFQSSTAQAAITLAVRRRQTDARVRVASTLQMGGSGIDGRLAARIAVDEGSLDTISADVTPGWSIDGVESVPADAIGEWYVDGPPARRTIEFQLNRAVTPLHSIQISVTGRARQASSFEPRTLSSLNWLTWRGLEVEQNLLRIAAAEPFELEPFGDPPTIAGTDLTSDDRQLVGTPGDAPWLDLMSTSRDAAIRLAPRQGAYDAEIQLNALLSAGALTESYRINCRPRRSSIDHLLMYVPEELAEPLEWVDEQSGESLVAERMPKNDPRLGGLPPGGELWQLRLRRLYARPVTITATRTEPWPERRRVPLVALPDAAEQRGRVVVESEGVALPTIVAARMRPTPLPPDGDATSPTERASDVRAIYRYQPVRFYDSGPTPGLWLGPPADAANGAELVAAQVQVESHYASSGSGVHRIEYLLENQGAETVDLELPIGVSLTSARIDGEPIVDGAQLATFGHVVVSLPPDRRVVRLELQLESQEQPLSSGLRLPPPLPAGPLTILRGEWTIWLPLEFNADGDAAAAPLGGFDWRRRIFGPLGRPAAERPFNPLARDDWNALWDSVDVFSTRSVLAALPRDSAPPLPDGWHACRFDFVAAPPAAVTITHPPAIAAWSLAVFLVCLVAPLLIGLQTTHTVALALAAAATCLLLPAFIAPLAAGAVLGLLSSPLWRWSQSAWNGSPTTFVVLAAGMLLTSANAIAQVRSDALERVLVPVDSAGKPSGTKYFVTDRFLRQLLRSSSDLQPDRAWLLHDLRCDGELATQPETPALVAGKWTLTGAIETLSRDATIELPLDERQADWPAAALVDGIETPITWGAGGRRFSIRIAEPGRFRLAIPLRPHVIVSGGEQQIELSVPPVAGGALNLITPPSLVDLRVDGANSMRPNATTHASWEGTLDGSGRLVARWPRPLVTSSVHGSRRVDELLWLRIGPGGQELDVKFILAGGGWPAKLALRVDPRWEFVADEQDVARPTSDAIWDGRRWLHVDVPQEMRSRGSIRLRFRSRAGSPLGRLRVPTIELAEMTVESCLLAVSWDPAFECAPSPAAPMEAAAAADFAAAWGDAEPPALPQLLLDVGQLKSDWNLAVRPRAGESTVRESVSLTARTQRLDVVYQAEVTPAGADRFQWSLTVPPDLAIRDVVAEVAGKPVSLDWSRAAPDRLHLFFAHVMADPYRLRVIGSVPVTSGGRCQFPHVSVADRPQAAQAAALYRARDVLADWVFPADPPASADAGTSATPPVGEDSRFVRAYLIDPSLSGAVQIRVEPNQPKLSGATLTTLAHENGVWTATLRCRFQVDRGELDTLKLRVPANWAGPFDVTPPAATEVAPTMAAGGDSVVSIRLPHAAQPGEIVSLELRAPLTVADGQAPSAPRTAPVTSGTWRHFLALPTSLDGEPATWTRIGIEPAMLPDELRTEPWRAATETFRIATDAFDATLRPRTGGATSARVRLAETATFVGPEGGRLADTRFIIVPHGLNQCSIELSSEERLVRITLDDRPALARQLDQQHWQAQLGPAELPQVLEIVTRTVPRVGPRARFVELRRPILIQADQRIPVELSLWTLSRPIDAATPRVTNASLLTARELAALRLDRLASILRMATRSAIESPVVDGYNWYARWSQQLAAAGQIAEALEKPVAGATAPARVTPPNGDLLADAAKRSAAWMQEMDEVFVDAGPAAAHADPQPEAAIDPWQGQAADLSHSTPVCLVADGGQDQLSIELVPVELTPSQARLAALASIFVLAAAAFWIRRVPAASALLTAWPQATLVLIGLATWAWLRPSALGLLIAAIGVGLVLRRLVASRRNMAQEKSPRHDNTRQPNSIPEDSA